MMKKLLSIFAGLFLTGFTVNATIFERGYGNSFIFVEQGIEFAIFPDGQFDFNVDRYGPNYGAHANFSNVSISFNTGYDYNAYVQYDDYGAVIQIENIPIYYDYYGRISQAGNVRIHYNKYGYISRVGGLYIYYNRHNRYAYSTGFINIYNRHYVYRSWHDYYIIPSINYCVVYNRPYRKYYTTTRHHYYTPYTNNYREYSRIESSRNTVASNSRRSDRYIQNKNKSVRSNAASRRSNSVSQNNATRKNSAVSRTYTTRRGNKVSKDNTLSGNTSATNRIASRDRGNTVNTGRVTSISKSRVSTEKNTNRRTVKSNTVRTNKPHSSSEARVAGNQNNRKTNSTKKRAKRSDN